MNKLLEAEAKLYVRAMNTFLEIYAFIAGGVNVHCWRCARLLLEVHAFVAGDIRVCPLEAYTFFAEDKNVCYWRLVCLLHV